MDPWGSDGPPLGNTAIIKLIHNIISYLHDKLPPPGDPFLSHQGIHGILLLLGLLDLNESADGIDALTVVWIDLLLDLDQILGLSVLVLLLSTVVGLR